MKTTRHKSRVMRGHFLVQHRNKPEVYLGVKTGRTVRVVHPSPGSIVTDAYGKGYIVWRDGSLRDCRKLTANAIKSLPEPFRTELKQRMAAAIQAEVERRGGVKFENAEEAQ